MNLLFFKLMLEFPVNFYAKLALEFIAEFLHKTNARNPNDFFFAQDES